jgi:serine/threonine-protein kinase HipA
LFLAYKKENEGISMKNRTAEIYFKDKYVGLLTEMETGGTRFSYDVNCTEEIACCFPIIQRHHEWPNRLHPFFQHLAPEGWLRGQQARTAHIVEEDDLGLLLRYGKDCIGAVSITPLKNYFFEGNLTESVNNPGRTISGVQKKLLVIKGENKKEFIPALSTGIAPYIGKFNSAQYPDLVHNEYLSLRWVAAILGKEDVTEFELGSVPVLGENALIVKRFDRGVKGEKLRLEDFAQILSKPRGDDYSGKYDAAYEDIADAIINHSARPKIDLDKFYKRLIVFSLVGNTDAHLKNFSLLETPIGLRLSPVYDVINTAIYKNHDQTLALSMRGKKISLDMINRTVLKNFGQDIGLSSKKIDQTFVELKRYVRKADRIIKPHEADSAESFKNRFEEVVRNACYRILGE